MNVPVYCLNLKRSVDRRLHMESQFRALRWEVQFVDALDGARVLDRGRLIREGTLSRANESVFGELSLSEIGCFFSHARAWHLMLRAGQRMALICEDDIVFRDPPPDLTSLLPRLPGSFDLLYWNYLNEHTNPHVAAAFDPERDKPVARSIDYKVFRAWSCGGSGCYLVTRPAARRLLRSARPIHYPLDGYMGRMAFWHRLRHHALYPQAALPAGLPTTMLHRDRWSG